MNFDDFIQCCVMVKTLTDQFRGKDVQQRGIVQLRYEEVIAFYVSLSKASVFLNSQSSLISPMSCPYLSLRQSSNSLL